MSSSDSWKNSEQRLSLLRKISSKKTLDQLILDKLQLSPLSLRDLQNQLRNNSPGRTISQKKLLDKIDNSPELILYRSHVPLETACISKLHRVRYVGLSDKIEADLLRNFNDITYLTGTHYTDLKSDANGRI